MKTTYDASGTPLGVLDAVGHTSCTIGASSYTTCAVYDAFGTHVTSVIDARSNTTTAAYNATTAAGGYGQWLLSTTDVNGQTTSYQYDVLGRLTAVVRPLDSTGNPSATSTYTNTCTNGGTTPCLEIDTATRTTSAITVGGSRGIKELTNPAIPPSSKPTPTPTPTPQGKTSGNGLAISRNTPRVHFNDSYIRTSLWQNSIENAWSNSYRSISSFEWHLQWNWNAVKMGNMWRGES